MSFETTRSPGSSERTQLIGASVNADHAGTTIRMQIETKRNGDSGFMKSMTCRFTR